MATNIKPQSASSSTPTRKGREHYNSTKLLAKRDRKRREAEARQFEHDKLTTRQKLALAMDVNRRGESKKEIARLQELLKNHPEPVKAKYVLPVVAVVPPPAVEVEVKPKRQPKSKVVKAAKTKAVSKKVKKTKEAPAE